MFFFPFQYWWIISFNAAEFLLLLLYTPTHRTNEEGTESERKKKHDENKHIFCTHIDFTIRQSNLID